jgi:DNA-binding XRE family transcriptional regulator
MTITKEQIRRLIKALDMTIEQFAKSIHLSRTTMYRLLNTEQEITEKYNDMIMHKYELFIMKNEKNIL